MLLLEKRLDLAHRHATRVHRDDLVVEARETRLVLGVQQRLETALAVARHLDSNGSLVGHHRLGADAAAMPDRGGPPALVLPHQFAATGCVTHALES
jgi:hypothetical protein